MSGFEQYYSETSPAMNARVAKWRAAVGLPPLPSPEETPAHDNLAGQAEEKPLPDASARKEQPEHSDKQDSAVLAKEEGNGHSGGEHVNKGGDGKGNEVNGETESEKHWEESYGMADNEEGEQASEEEFVVVDEEEDEVACDESEDDYAY